MQADSRALARRHMWLSWWWGMGLVWAPALLFFLVIYGRGSTEKASVLIVQTLKGVPYFLGVLLLLIGVPAFLGNLARLIPMRILFRTVTSTFGLLSGTVLVFEVVVIGFWVLLRLYQWFGPPVPALMAIPAMQNSLSSLWVFFGLSLPWLLSSVVAAWWVTRLRFPNQPN